MAAKDNFSSQSGYYAAYRPHYPAELYSYIYKRMENFSAAWDCGTGNGQVAVQLSERFQRVYATDISRKQLERARKKNNIEYIAAPAEKSPIPSETIDLVTVAQALHWFDPKLFSDEVKRVCRTKAMLACWGYHLPQVSSEIDAALQEFHDHTVGPYWDDERKILLQEYSSLDLPLLTKEKAHFDYVVRWDISHLEGYLNSWSAVQNYIRQNNRNPIPVLINKLAGHWTEESTVVFPVFLILGPVG